ncbi:hypothetical protein Leryth_010973 [Lithospermum erythrorhizon]|nr:hypothetical protein Leryth_010973 [Lithospermum erythrorhizon]
MVIPWLVLVVDQGSAKTPSRVDTGAGDGNGGQVNHENSKSNWKSGKRAYRDMRISSTPFGISGREDSVDKNKSSNDLGG